MSRRRSLLVSSLALSAALIVPSVAATAQNAPWVDRGLMNVAHRGGALEAPENTPFAYWHSVRVGADILEMDTYETADGELVVIHDSTVDRTTDGTGDVSDFTVEQLEQLDAAYWFVPGKGTIHGEPDEAYVFRGIATGQKPVPADLAALGVTADDFRIPTLRQILERFDGHYKVIELKPDEGSTGSFEAKLADLLEEFGRTDDVIVGSFLDHHMRIFKALAPDVTTAPATAEVASYWSTSQSIGPGLIQGHAAFAVPPALGVTVVTQDFVDDAHAHGMAVYVWTINDCDEMVRLLNLDVDGIMTDAPTVLDGLLVQPEGQWDCAAVASGTGQPAPTPSDDGGAVAPEDESALPATGGGLVLGAVALLGAGLVGSRRRG